MAKHIGIVACSQEGAALCYQTICKESHKQMGEHKNPEISIHSISLDKFITLFDAGKWDDVAELMLISSKKLASIGAEFAICPDNTVHEAYDRVAPNSPIPWMSILEEVRNEAKKQGYHSLGILGTDYIMTSPLYQKKLNDAGISTQIPNEENRKKINDIIYDELANGLFTELSRAYFNRVIKKFRDDDAEAVILGSTELPILVDSYDCPLPTLDSTQILAHAALKRALTDD